MLCSLPVLLEEARLRVGALSVGRAELLEVFSWDRETVGVRVREVSLWIKVHKRDLKMCKWRKSLDLLTGPCATTACFHSEV